MKKLIVVVMAIIFAAGMAYAAESEKYSGEPVKTLVEDTGAVVETAAEGVADTIDITKNEPVTTAVKSTGKVAEAGVKTVTFQKIDKDQAVQSGSKASPKSCSK